MAFTLKIVTALQARNACGDFLADEVSEQAWFMTGKPHCKSPSPSEAGSLILSSTLVTTEGRTRIELKPAPAAFAWAEQMALYAPDGTVIPWDACNGHQAAYVARQAAYIADTFMCANEKGDHINRRLILGDYLRLIRHGDL